MVRTAADGDGTSSVSSSEPRDSVASNRFTRSTLSRLEKERSRLILELDEYRESNVALRSDLEQCVDRLNACEDELVFQHNELERSTKEGFHLKKKVEKMEGLLKREFGDDAATQYSALLDENERLQDELDDMAEEREQLEAELQHHQNTGGDIDDMTKQLEQLTEENKDLTSEVDDLKEESDRLRRKLAVLRTEHEVAVAKLSAIDQATQPVVQEGVQTDETWLPTIKEEGQEDTNTEGSTTTPPEAADNSSTRGRSLSQDTQLNTLRMAYDLLQEENEETKHQLAILTDASEDSGGAAAKLVDLQKQFDEYRKEHPDTPSTNATCSGEATPEKEQSRSNSSSTANSAIVPPPLVREDSNDVDPLEKNVDDLEGALREKDGKIAELQEYIADLERMQKEGVILDCKGNEVIPTTTPEGDKDDDDITKRAARLAAEIESYQEQLRAKDEQINELKKIYSYIRRYKEDNSTQQQVTSFNESSAETKSSDEYKRGLAEPVITKRRSSARSDGSKSQGSRSRGPSGGSNDATTAYDLDGNDVDSLKSRCKKLEEEKKLSDSQLEYVQSEYEKLRKEKEKQVMELEHTIVDTKLKLAQVHSQADGNEYDNYRSLRKMESQYGRDSPRKHDSSSHHSGGSSIRSRSKGIAKSVGKALGRKSSSANITKPDNH